MSTGGELKVVEEEEEEEEDCWIMGVSYRGRVRVVQVSAGLDLEELRSVLEALFGLRGRALALESSDGVCSPLSLVTNAPSYFGQRTEPFKLIVSNDTEEEDDEDDEEEEEEDDTVVNRRRSFEEIVESHEMFCEQFGDDEFQVNEFDVRRVCAVFFSLPSLEFGKMSRETYALCVRQLLNEHTILDEDRARAVLARIWVAFAESSRGDRVDGSALLVGLSSICGGDKLLKLSESFALLDTNGDQVLDLNEMERYFYAVFLVARERDPLAFRASYPSESGDPSILALASATAEACFAAADANHDGVVTFDEFQAWATPSLPPLDEAAKTLGLDAVEASEVFHCMTQRSHNNNNEISRSHFTAMCVEGDFTYDEAPTESERSARLAVASRLFDLFDPNGTGSVNIQNLAAGVGALCGHGRSESNVQFFLGESIAYDALCNYFFAVFTVLCDAPNHQKKRSPEKLAQATTARCFRDLDNPETISYEDFRKWCGLTASSASLNRASPDDEEDFDEEYDDNNEKKSTHVPKPIQATRPQAQQPPKQNITALRAAMNLRSLSEVASVFSNAQQPLLAADFIDCIKTMCTHLDEDLHSIATILFEALARGKKTVDPMAAVLSLSVLCGESSKAQTLFQLLSADGERLSKADLFMYLRSVFRIVEALEMNGSKEHNPDNIAVVATDRALSGKSHLTKQQFLDWYKAGMVNADKADNTSSSLVVTEEETQATDPIEQKLQQLADADGCIDRDAFMSTLNGLFRDDPAMTSEWLHHLFDVVRSKALHHTVQVPANRIRKKVYPANAPLPGLPLTILNSSP